MHKRYGGLLTPGPKVPCHLFHFALARNTNCPGALWFLGLFVNIENPVK